MQTQGKHNFDYVPINAGREFATQLKDGVAVGTIREVVPVAKDVKIPCPHCGHEEYRTQWQADNRFKCYECHRMSDEVVDVR
jgi:predicted RNA-binding Zn-ribbon protein involved in translation (DUF1610 family)